MSFLLLLLGSTLIASAFTCPTYYNLEHSSCTFHVQHTDSSCNSFVFQKCTWIQCGSNNNHENDGNCGQKVIKNDYSWSSCTSRCCDSNVVYNKNTGAITQCRDYLNSIYEKKIAMILGTTFGILILSVLITCLCCLKCKYGPCIGYRAWVRRNCPGCLCLSCFSQNEQYIVSSSQQGINHIYQQGKDVSNDKKAVKKKTRAKKSDWTRDQTPNEKLKNICSVCLDDRPTFELNCGHVYHRKCIVACIRRSQQCPVCRSTDFSKIKAYCQLCGAAYHSISFINGLTRFENQRQICDGCKKGQMSAGENWKDHLMFIV